MIRLLIFATALALAPATFWPLPAAAQSVEAKREAAPAKSMRSQKSSKAKAPPRPIETVSAANAEARRQPARDGFIDAAHVYDFAPGAIFELYTTPEFLSTILLEEGETLKTTAAGDTARWMVEAVPAAGRGDARTLILVKPLRAGIRTNIVLVTDRRTYLVEAVAQAGRTYSAQISWTYPAIIAARLAPSQAVDLNALNFRYQIERIRGAAPRWKPVRVFDDGRKTFIEFPLDMATSEAPPLFLRRGDRTELMNYRVIGNRYVVDRLFDQAELRLGDRRPTIVRIARERTQQTGAKP